jgi:hypothetical protein
MTLRPERCHLEYHLFAVGRMMRAWKVDRCMHFRGFGSVCIADVLSRIFDAL